METAPKKNRNSVSDRSNRRDSSPFLSDCEEMLPEEPAKPQHVSSSTKNKEKSTSVETHKKSEPKIILNISDTKYDVVKYVGRKLMGYKLVSDPDGDWDVFWTDNAIQPETLARMQPHQKINHFPGMYALARKNHLARNLMRMKKMFPAHFKFFPQTYLLPAEYNDFKMQVSNKGTSKTFILKPQASCQGRGIFLTKTWESVQMGEPYVAQRYLEKPLLLDGLKFDLRIYVLLAGCDPLRIYLFQDGLARFATETYVAPTAENMENMCVHLTNYAINKDNPNFVFNQSVENDNIGHKRSLKAVLKVLEEQGHNVKKLWEEIKKIIIKTFCCVQPVLAHGYKSCQPDEPYNNMCFQILGFDVMLDHKMKPWLLEVNHTPSFTTDTPLDKTIKRNVIRDALKIMNISMANRIKQKTKKKEELQERVLKGRKSRMTAEEKQEIFKKAQQERDEWENQNLGDYEKIFPIDEPGKGEEYTEFIKTAHSLWEQWTGTAIRERPKKPVVIDNSKPPLAPFGQNGTAPNQTIRAKEIQNIYSQKLKIGSTTLKGPNQQKSKKPDELPQTGSGSRSNMVTSTNFNFSRQGTAQRSETAFSYKLNNDIQPWMEDDENDSDSLINQEEWEDNDRDSMGTIVRTKKEKTVKSSSHIDKLKMRQTLSSQESQFFKAKPDSAGADSFVNFESPGGSLRTNSIIHSEPGTGPVKFGSFRIRKGIDLASADESSRKFSPTREGLRQPLGRKADSLGNQGQLKKPSTAATVMVTKVPEKLAGIYGTNRKFQDRKTKPPKPFLRLGTGVIGEIQDFGEKVAVKEGFVAGPSAKNIEPEGITSSTKNNYYVKPYKNKMEDPLPLLPKKSHSTQNLALNKLLDLKPETLKREGVNSNLFKIQRHSGLKSLERGGNKEDSARKELNNSSNNALNNTPQSRNNTQRT